MPLVKAPSTTQQVTCVARSHLRPGAALLGPFVVGNIMY